MKLSQLIVAAVLLPWTALAQTISLKAVDGKTGHVLARQRLLVFAGADANEVRYQKYHYDLTTNEAGSATLEISDSAIQRIQVWADYKTLCQSTPNLRSFDLAKITSAGLETPNTCGHVTSPRVPGELVIYARPRTRREIRNQ